MKIHVHSVEGYPKHFYFTCPGCGHEHAFGEGWSFNGDVERPTVSPSILVTARDDKGNEISRCHSFIRDGMIEFCADSRHGLTGQTVPLPDVDMSRFG